MANFAWLRYARIGFYTPVKPDARMFWCLKLHREKRRAVRKAQEVIDGSRSS